MKRSICPTIESLYHESSSGAGKKKPDSRNERLWNAVAPLMADCVEEVRELAIPADIRQNSEVS